MKILLLVILCGIIALLEAPPLLKKKHFKELSVFAVFLLFAFSIALLQILGVKLPNPYKGIGYIVEHLVKIKFEYQEI